LPSVTALGGKPGDIAAVAWHGLFRHWLLTLALETLGVTTFSFRGKAPPDFVPAKLVIDPDDAWWESALQDPPVELPALLEPNFAHRLVISSGTTGSPKIMAPTPAQEHFRIEVTRQIYDFTDESRFLVGVGFTLQSDHRRATVCLRAGGVSIYEDGAVIEEAIPRAKPTHIVLMPLHLQAIAQNVDTLRDVGPLNVSAIGGYVPDAARKMLTQDLGFTLIESYGTNETGPLANVTEEGWATPLPGVSFRIVGEYGGPLPAGSEGIVEVSSPGTVAGYLNDPAMTADRFRDGWFRPGDLGVLDESGRLRLAGRADDLLNVGGYKLSAVALDEYLRARPEFFDGAATTFHDTTGQSFLAIFVCPKSEIDETAIQTAVQEVVPEAGLRNVRIVRVQAIPRTSTGKVRRHELTNLLEAALQDRPGS